MTNLQCVLVYTPFVLINCIFLLDLHFAGKHKRLVLSTMFFRLGLLFWQLFEICFFILPEPWQIRYVFDLKLIFVSVVSVSIFYMFIFFYRLDKLLPGWLVPILFLVPAVTTVLALTTPRHNLLIAGWELLSVSPLTTIQYVRGAWYWVHTLYCQLLLVMFLMLLPKRNKLPRGYRSSSSFIILGIVIYFTFTILESFRLTGLPLDFNLIGAGIGNVFFYIAIMSNRRSDYLHIERTEIFNLLDQAVFILDQNGFAIDANASGHKWLALLGHNLGNKRFDTLIDGLHTEDKIRFTQIDERGVQDIFIPGAQFPLFYHMTYRQLGAQSEPGSGTIAILADVTENRLLIERLREQAGIDPLTGLPNRNCYQALLRTLDHDENLPLSIILGDANGLKAINDSLGHEQGDLLLRQIARTLEAHCPPGGYVARIGGDEFALLLPKCSAEYAAAAVAAIRRGLRNLPQTYSHPLMALGFATKMRSEQNLSSLIREADENMYADKRE